MKCSQQLLPGNAVGSRMRTHVGETGTRMPVKVRRRLQSRWDRVSPRFAIAHRSARTPGLD